jgi:hypothetical protein
LQAEDDVGADMRVPSVSEEKERREIPIWEGVQAGPWAVLWLRLKSAPGAFSSLPSFSLFLFLVLFENFANETLFDSNKF